MADEHWKTLQLGDCLTLQRGFDLPAAERKPGSIPVVSSSGITGYHSTAPVRGPGVVTGRYGTIGEVFYVEQDFWPLNTTLWVKDFKGNTPKFASFLLRTIDFRSCSDKSNVPGVNRNDLHRILVDLPPPGQRQAIADVLSAFDDKIELNRRMNQTLESMARAIFRSWFVDFDPVVAKAAGRQPFGMSADVAAHFSSHFVNSAVGPLPDGWGVSDIGREFSVVMGQSPPGHTYNEEANGLPFYQGRTDFGIRYPKLRVFCSAPTRYAEAGDTLISVRAPVGGLNIALHRCCIGRGLAAVRHTAGSRGYTYYALWSVEGEFDKFNADGTVFGSISKRDFHGISCLAPPQAVIDAYDQIVAPLDGLIETNTRQTALLAALRDTLLPKLMSGELRVRDAEKLAGIHV